MDDSTCNITTWPQTVTGSLCFNQQRETKREDGYMCTKETPAVTNCWTVTMVRNRFFTSSHESSLEKDEKGKSVCCTLCVSPSLKTYLYLFLVKLVPCCHQAPAGSDKDEAEAQILSLLLQHEWMFEVLETVFDIDLKRIMWPVTSCGHIWESFISRVFRRPIENQPPEVMTE